jgi:hypothetical protein
MQEQQITVTQSMNSCAVLGAPKLWVALPVPLAINPWVITVDTFAHLRLQRPTVRSAGPRNHLKPLCSPFQRRGRTRPRLASEPAMAGCAGSR